MAKMTALYRTPADIAAFEKHYFEVHIPLAKKLPGLQKYEGSRSAPVSITGHSGIYLIGQLYFENMEAIKHAFSSEIGRQCAQDRLILAPNEGDVQIYLYDTITV